MIIKIKRFSSPTNILKNPKPKILGSKSAEITSKNGIKFRRRLDEDSNLNLGKELSKLNEERRNLNKIKMEII